MIEGKGKGNWCLEMERGLLECLRMIWLRGGDSIIRIMGVLLMECGGVIY